MTDEYNDDRARFEAHKDKLGAHLAVRCEEGWNPRNVAVVIPTPEVVAHGMMDFAVLPAEQFAEVCRAIGAAMPAPPSPGQLLVAVPFVEAPTVLALRTFEVPLLTADELARDSERTFDEELVTVSTDEQRAALGALDAVAASWVDVVTARTSDGAHVFRYRVLRCDAFDAVIRTLDDDFVESTRRGPTPNTIITKRVHSPRTVRAINEEKDALARHAESVAPSVN